MNKLQGNKNVLNTADTRVNRPKVRITRLAFGACFDVVRVAASRGMTAQFEKADEDKHNENC